MPGMGIVLSMFGIAFGAFCVWLTVRIFNRREKWAKWALAAALVTTPILYVATFGLWCRANRGGPGEIKAAAAVSRYHCMWWLYENGPDPVRSAIKEYVKWCLQ